ncbi:predicted protein [Arabidopsis lyrata subsp. lyrata]|uniref:Predicted protein n=1 Tax=Arabidopsis lyrata subsp. lyrata TaxID=81972 RepID=D7KP22_ARALL|nr:predicted protein [Arabidopsis lyrata subsp. lyrata]
MAGGMAGGGFCPRECLGRCSNKSFVIVGKLVMKNAWEGVVTKREKITATLKKEEEFEHPVLYSFLQDPF